MHGARLHQEIAADGRAVVRLEGEWTLRHFDATFAAISARLLALGADPRAQWDLTGITAFDSAGAMAVWRAWGRKRREGARINAVHEPLFARIAAVPPIAEPVVLPDWARPLIRIGRRVFVLLENMTGVAALLGQMILDMLYLVRHPKDIPWREISANIHKAGTQALPVTAMVGFLIGVVLSYLSALQLKNFGADIYIIDILGVGVTREMAPVLAAVLIAGRSGSAMTAHIGVMRVTEEIDAMATMGIPASMRLVLPKILALSIATPLLVLWTMIAAILGGMLSANFQLGLAYSFFLETLPKVVPVANLWIGVIKGVLFGVVVAVVACHYGLRIRPNTESLSAGTTGSVVTAISSVIVVDAIFAILTKDIGLDL
jgi:phospholipid/cholesterol/gamma-HCH transport system permease protein